MPHHNFNCHFMVWSMCNFFLYIVYYSSKLRNFGISSNWFFKESVEGARFRCGNRLFQKKSNSVTISFLKFKLQYIIRNFPSALLVILYCEAVKKWSHCISTRLLNSLYVSMMSPQIRLPLNECKFRCSKRSLYDIHRHSFKSLVALRCTFQQQQQLSF